MIIRIVLLVVCLIAYSACKQEKQTSQSTPTVSDSSKSELSSEAGEFKSEHQLLGVAVIPEEILNQWGYLTIKIEDQSHTIRSKKNYGDSETAFYARFYLAKARYDNEAEATKEKKRIEAHLSSMAGFKDYTQIIQKDNELYSITPSGNYVYLSHQPKLVDNIKSFLSK